MLLTGAHRIYEPVEVVMTPNECLTLGDEAPELKLLIESDGTVTFIVSDYSYAEAGLTAVLLPDEHGGLVAGHNAYSVPDGKSYNYAQTGFTIQGRITEAYHNQLMDKGSDGTARMCSFFESEFYDEPTYVFEKSQTTIGKGMTEDGDYYTIGTIVYDTPEGFFFKLFYWPDTGEYRLEYFYRYTWTGQTRQYRETLFDEVQREALADVAKEIGRPVDELYVMNVSNGANRDYLTGKKVPADRDISYCQKVLSDPSGKLDLTIDQTIGERAVARRLYKKMMGKEADTIEEALQFMKDKDVTYVNPNYDAGNYVFEHNLNGYEDLAGMVGLTRDANGKLVMDKSLLDGDLHNKVINQKSVFYKGVEWFETDAKASLKEAIKYEQKA